MPWKKSVGCGATRVWLNNSPRVFFRIWPGRNNAEDKNRSLGFSSGNLRALHPKNTAFLTGGSRFDTPADFCPRPAAMLALPHLRPPHAPYTRDGIATSSLTPARWRSQAVFEYNLWSLRH
jgi:hypothetical protein